MNTLTEGQYGKQYLKLMQKGIGGNKKYLVLLVDRKRARMFTFLNGKIDGNEEVMYGYVPQNVKHGSNTWDSEKKIFRHIENHLHLHLAHVGKNVGEFSKKNKITGIVIGGHKPLFPKIQKHIPYPFSNIIIGTFTSELKVPIDEITRRANKIIDKAEQEEVYKQIDRSLTK